MSKLNAWRPLLIALIVIGIPVLAAAGTINVKTVPWVATNPLIPHDIWSGTFITLKGTADQQGGSVVWVWDFGDGSNATGTVGNQYAIEAQHVYTGTAGTIYTARLTVTNNNTGDTGTQVTYVAIRNKSLSVEVNRAIDEGLWYLHKNLSRYVDSYGQPAGDWSGMFYGFYGGNASTLQAFEVNGHLQTGDSSNPYVEDVQRAMRSLFTQVATAYIGGYSTSGTGYGVGPNQGDQFYQGGMFMDAIVASGTPNATAPTGPSGGGPDPGIVGRTFKAIVWDMMDYYYYCQYPYTYGGWRYNCRDWPDNSASQWGAIGILAVDRTWSVPIPAPLISLNINWLNYSQNPNTGWFGYPITIRFGDRMEPPALEWSNWIWTALAVAIPVGTWPRRLCGTTGMIRMATACLRRTITMRLSHSRKRCCYTSRRSSCCTRRPRACPISIGTTPKSARATRPTAWADSW